MLRDTVNNASLILTVILRTQFAESTSNLTTMLSGTLKVLIVAFLNQFIIFETEIFLKGREIAQPHGVGVSICLDVRLNICSL